MGHEVTLRVLDVNKANGIVELTAKEDLLLGTQQAKQSKKGDKKKKKDKSATPQVKPHNQNYARAKAETVTPYYFHCSLGALLPSLMVSDHPLAHLY